jgi:hypothetical protein
MITPLPIKTAKAKNFYRKDAKTAKKKQKSPNYLPGALVTLAYAGVHSCLPLRPLRLRGENAFVPLFSV